MGESGLDVPTISAEMLAGLFGLVHDDLVRKALPGMPFETADGLILECHRREQAALRAAPAHTLLFRGVLEGLRRLSDTAPVYVVSNCELGYMDAFLADEKVGRFITDWECFGRTGEPKARNLARVVARHQLQLPVFVGDTEGDQIAATEAGIAFIHANYGFGTVSGEYPQAESFESLVALLLRS